MISEAPSRTSAETTVVVNNHTLAQLIPRNLLKIARYDHNYRDNTPNGIVAECFTVLASPHGLSEENTSKANLDKMDRLKWAFYVVGYTDMNEAEQDGVQKELLEAGPLPIVAITPETTQDLQWLWQHVGLQIPTDAIAREILEDRQYQTVRYIGLPRKIVTTQASRELVRS